MHGNSFLDVSIALCPSQDTTAATWLYSPLATPETEARNWQGELILEAGVTSPPYARRIVA
jgi:hypothetical protein